VQLLLKVQFVLLTAGLLLSIVAKPSTDPHGLAAGVAVMIAVNGLPIRSAPVGFATRGLHGGHDGQFDQRRTNERIAAVAMTACGSSVPPSPRRRSRSCKRSYCSKAWGHPAPQPSAPPGAQDKAHPKSGANALPGQIRRASVLFPTRLKRCAPGQPRRFVRRGDGMLAFKLGNSDRNTEKPVACCGFLFGNEGGYTACTNCKWRLGKCPLP
jgi:hypothetical protein